MQLSLVRCQRADAFLVASFRMLIPQLVFRVSSLDGHVKPLEVMFRRNRKISVVISKEERLFLQIRDV